MDAQNQESGQPSWSWVPTQRSWLQDWRGAFGKKSPFQISWEEGVGGWCSREIHEIGSQE